MSLNIISFIYNTYSESCEAGFGFDIFSFPHSVNSADVSTSFNKKTIAELSCNFSGHNVCLAACLQYQPGSTHKIIHIVREALRMKKKVDIELTLKATSFLEL